MVEPDRGLSLDLLKDALIPVEGNDGAAFACDLPVVLTRLCAREVASFPGLAAHQRQPWFFFLVQLAAVALHREGRPAPDFDAAWRGLADPDGWRARLATLTPDEADAAWRLVVDDLKRPAFLQPPVPAGTLDGYEPRGRQPDAIDVLVTSKLHDVKGARAGRPEPHHWLYALVTLQTAQGFLGAGNYGIARMNGGFASRPLLELVPHPDWGARFRRGVQTALAARPRVLRDFEDFAPEDGLALLWLDPWNGEASLGLDRLDPFFIEVCRRLRLARAPDGAIVAHGRGSKAARVAAKDYKGRLGDPWTPIRREDGAALSVGEGGFDYRLICRLLDPKEYDLPASFTLRPDDPPEGMWLHTAVLARGQGETQGLHDRWLMIHHGGARFVCDVEERPRLGAIGKVMMADAGAAKKCLRGGLAAFLQGGPDKIDWSEERGRDWLAELDRRIDGLFFGHLWTIVAARDDIAEHERAEAAWRVALVTAARTTFDTALDRLPAPENRRERARALAEREFEGRLYKTGLKTARATAPADDDARQEVDA